MILRDHCGQLKIKYHFKSVVKGAIYLARVVSLSRRVYHESPGEQDVISIGQTGHMRGV